VQSLQTSNRSTPRHLRPKRDCAGTSSGQKWGTPYPALAKLWASAWSEFVPFLDYGPMVHRASGGSPKAFASWSQVRPDLARSSVIRSWLLAMSGGR